MLRTFLVLAALSIVLTGCVKSDAKVTLKNDGSGTLSYESTYNVAAVEDARERVAEMQARAEESGRGGAGASDATDRIDKFVKSFDPEQVRTDLKARGIEVVSVKPVEKEGWKGVAVEAKFENVNQMVARIRELELAARSNVGAEEQPAGEGDRPRRRGRGGMGRMGRGFEYDATPILPSAFEKTPEPAIGRVVLVKPAPAMGGGRQADGANRRGGRGGGMGGGGMPGMDDLRRTLRITFPGKIVNTTNCKKEDDHTVVIEMKGSELAPDEDGNLPPILREGASVSFEIPEGSKITFDEPAGAKKAENEGEKKDEPAKRKGDLKIGEGQ